MATCPSGHSSAAADYCDVCGARIGAAPAPGASAPGAGVPGAGVPGAGCPDCGTPGTGRFCENCGYDYAVGGGRPTPPAVQPFPPFPGPTPGPVAAPGQMNPPSPGAPGPGPGAGEDEPVTRDWSPPQAPVPPGPVPEPASAPRADEDPVTRDWSPPPNRPPVPHAGWTAVVTADREYYDRVIVEGEGFTFPPYHPERQIPLTGAQVRIGRRSASQGTAPEIDLSEPPADPGVSHTHAVLLAKPDGTWTLVDPGSTNGTSVNGSNDPIPVNVEVPLRDGDRIHVGVWTTITLRRPR